MPQLRLCLGIELREGSIDGAKVLSTESLAGGLRLCLKILKLCLEKLRLF